MQIKHSRSRILKEDRLNKSVGPGSRTHSKLDLGPSDEPEAQSFIVEPVPKIKPSKKLNTIEGTMDTDVEEDHEKVAKVPLELFVHPKSNKWVFRKAEETKSLNKRLKYRFKKNHSPNARSPDKHLQPIEYPANVESLFKHIHERTGFDNHINSILKLINKGSLPHPQLTRTPSPYKGARSRSSLPPQQSKPDEQLSPNQSSQKEIGVGTTPLPSFRQGEFTSYSNSPVKKKASPPEWPEPTRRLSPKINRFLGKLEPALKIQEKYVQPYQEPEIKLTPGQNVFIGRTPPPGVKPKLLVNMNRVTFMEVEPNKESIPKEEVSYDTYDYAKKINLMKNNSPFKAMSHREKSPEKFKRMDITGSNMIQSSRIINENSNKPRATSYSKFHESRGSRLFGFTSETHESKPMLVKIDSNQYVLPDEKAMQRPPTRALLNNN